jgi:hypothetical protein
VGLVGDLCAFGLMSLAVFIRIIDASVAAASGGEDSGAGGVMLKVGIGTYLFNRGFGVIRPLVYRRRAARNP